MEGLYVPTRPTRIMDTRTGLSGHHRLGPGRTASLLVAGAPAGQPVVPAVGAMAAVLNVTVVRPTRSGHLTVYQGPVGSGPPGTSSVSFHPGWVGANLVTVGLGSQGRVAIYNSAGYTDVVVDVIGWYANAQAADTPALAYVGSWYRLLFDTRKTQPLAPGQTLNQTVAKPVHAGSPYTMKALVVVLTASHPAAGGYLTAWSGEGPAPAASTLNFTSGSVAQNLVVVPVVDVDAASMSFAVRNGSSGSTDVVAVVVGVYGQGTISDIGRFSLNSARLADTRRPGPNAGPLGDDTSRSFPFPDVDYDHPWRVLNVTSVPRVNTFINVWGYRGALISTSSPRAGSTLAAATYIDLTGGDQTMPPTQWTVIVYNARGPNDIIVDQVGWFLDPWFEA
jgi:hypothetical protein